MKPTIVRIPITPLVKPAQWILESERRWDQAVSDGDRGPWFDAILGGWGSAKTTHAAMLFVLRCLKLPAGSNATVIAPTVRIVMKAVVPKLEQVMPPQLIVRKKGAPHPEWRLVNGVTVSFISGDSQWEGEDQSLIWVDEVHRLAGDDARWVNFRMRLREQHDLPLGMIVSGLPEAGWTRENFDPERLDPGMRGYMNTALIGTADNPYLPEGQVAQIKASCPAGYESSLIGGGWMPMQGALYQMFSTDRHIVPDSEDDGRTPLSMGLDIGVHAGAVAGYSRQLGHGKGVLIVDDLVGENRGVRQMCTDMRDRHPGRWVPGLSRIAVDPTIRYEEEQAVREVFQGCEVVIRKRTDPLYSVVPGIRLVQATLLNAEGKISWNGCSRLKKTRRGIVDALLGTKTKNGSRGMGRIKDDTLDHVEDANRYLVNALLGDQGFAPRAWS